MLLVGLIIACFFYEVLTEEQPYQKKLLDKQTELNYQGDDVAKVLEEVETLFQYREKNWNLGRVMVRQVKNSKDELEYSNIYLYYNPKDETTARYQRIRLFYEKGRWNISEAYELDETYDSVAMGENISSFMLEKMMGLADEQINDHCLEGDEYDISVSSERVFITVFQINDQQEKSITERLYFQIQETGDGYQLSETNASE